MENRGENKMEKKILVLSIALLTGLAISAGDVNAATPFGKVTTHIGATSVNKTSVINTWPESQVKGYLGKGKVVTGYDAKGEAVVGTCHPPYGPTSC
jgi:hypothetical protein